MDVFDACNTFDLDMFTIIDRRSLVLYQGIETDVLQSIMVIVVMGFYEYIVTRRFTTSDR